MEKEGGEAKVTIVKEEKSKVAEKIEETKDKKEGFKPALIRVIALSVVIVSVIYFVMARKVAVGPVLITLGILPLIFVYFAGRSVKSVAADIVFGIIDTGILGIMALIGASFAGILGAVVGAAAGDAITDGFAGLFEGKVAEHMRKNGTEESRTPLSASMGKMSGCLIGIGITLTVAWTMFGL